VRDGVGIGGCRCATTARDGGFMPGFCICTEHGNGTQAVKGFPGDALRISHPVLVRFGIAAVRPDFGHQTLVRSGQLLAHALKLGVGVDLQAQVIHAGPGAAR